MPFPEAEARERPGAATALFILFVVSYLYLLYLLVRAW